MNKANLNLAANKARTFLNAVAAMRERLVRDTGALLGSRESGALRRASMELSRALAELRKS